MVNQRAEINKDIAAARVVLVTVAGTEFYVKISKSEARALNKHMDGLLEVRKLDDGTLYLEGMV